MNPTSHSPSVIVIEFEQQLDPAAYAAVVFGVWATLVAGGHARDAVIRPDNSATDQQLEDVLETLIGTSRWGW